MSTFPRRRFIAPLAVSLAAILLAGCPSTPVQQPSTRPPAQTPSQPQTPPSTERPVVRPPLATGYPAQIALLLPLSGRQEAAGIAVRDGFMAAWFSQPAATRPNVRMYDVSGRDGASVILQAVSDGAQFIVGPLVKDEVAAVATMADGRTPILALNFLPDETTAPRRFYQFALSPEDEARQVAQRAIADGRSRGAVLVPAGDWGTRILKAFTTEMQQLGGSVVANGVYIAEESDHSPVIQKLFRLSESRERHQKLTALLGTKLEFQPRRRSDIQFIFVAAQPAQGRSIRPQLKFHYAGDVPMYSTSDIFEADPNGNIDLDGVNVLLMPWSLAGNPAAEGARSALERAWPSRVTRRGNLYAFGYDAWRLIPELMSRAQNPNRAAQTNERLDGVTGRLSIDARGQIHRELDWAQIRDGRPEPLKPD